MAGIVESTRSYGKRPDGSSKGRGYLGEIPTKDGRVATEITIGVNLGGKETDIPLLVPTLTKEEVKHLANGGSPTKDMVDKAVEHAKTRMGQGLSPYAN